MLFAAVNNNEISSAISRATAMGIGSGVCPQSPILHHESRKCKIYSMPDSGSICMRHPIFPARNPHDTPSLFAISGPCTRTPTCTRHVSPGSCGRARKFTCNFSLIETCYFPR
jgi:hypothetical protein